MFTVWMVSKENHGVWNEGEECIPIVLMAEITEYTSENSENAFSFRRVLMYIISPVNFYNPILCC